MRFVNVQTTKEPIWFYYGWAKNLIFSWKSEQDNSNIDLFQVLKFFTLYCERKINNIRLGTTKTKHC